MDPPNEIMVTMESSYAAILAEASERLAATRRPQTKLFFIPLIDEYIPYKK